MFASYCKKIIDNLKLENRYRIFKNIYRNIDNYPIVKLKKKNIIVWCSNDYCNMSQHPTIINAAIETINNVGVGAGGTRNIAGSSVHIENLENYLAKFLNKDKTIVLGSGYMANLASLSVLGSIIPETVIFSDEKNHASMIEGIKRSGAKCHIFNHNDTNTLEKLLSIYPYDKPKIIAFESVYSMDSSIANIPNIVYLAKKYNAITYCDEIHAVGLYGKNAIGISEEQNINNNVDILMGGFGKAIGILGGYVGGNEYIIDTIRSLASPFIFTTALPPLLCIATEKSIEILRNNEMMRHRVRKNAEKTREIFKKYEIPFINSNSHIVPVIINDATRCNLISDKLLYEYGHYVQPINYPTVKKGSERLRVTPSNKHTETMIEDLARCLKESLRG